MTDMPAPAPAENEPTTSPRGLDPEVITHALRGSLTAISVRTQLLTRRIQRGQIQGAQECLSGLATIEQAAWALETRLRALEELMDTQDRARTDEVPPASRYPLGYDGPPA